MSKIKKQLLAGPYLIWIIGFIILPLFMIVYYAFKGSDGGFTFEYVAAIAQHTNIMALLLSLKLGIICTIICLVLSYPLAMIPIYHEKWGIAIQTLHAADVEGRIDAGIVAGILQ